MIRLEFTTASIVKDKIKVSLFRDVGINRMDWPKLIAHRGASLLAPENTLVAFKLAKTHNAHWIECDVTLTQDGVPIIFHDKTLKRQTGINKKN